MVRRFISETLFYLGKHPSGAPLPQPVIRVLLFVIPHCLVDLRKRVVQGRLASARHFQHAKGHGEVRCVATLYGMHERDEDISLAAVKTTCEDSPTALCSTSK